MSGEEKKKFQDEWLRDPQFKEIAEESRQFEI